LIFYNKNVVTITYEVSFKWKPVIAYLYSDNGNTQNKEDWRADGYTWRNNGKRLFESEGFFVEKHSFRIVNNGEVSAKFQKHAFRFSEKYNGKTLIVYYGDIDEYENMPHGNRKRNKRPHKRVKPLFIKSIKIRKDENPQEIYNSLKSDNLNELVQGTSVPRNNRQVQNIQAYFRKKTKLSHVRCMVYICWSIN